MNSVYLFNYNTLGEERALKQQLYSRRFLRALALLSATTLLACGKAYAFDIQIKIVEIIAQVSFDELSESDFYAEVTADGIIRDNFGTPGQQQWEGNDTVAPPFNAVGTSDWTLSVPVDPTSVFVPITIKIFDDDDDNPGSGGDDQADVENGPGTNVDITLDLTTCTFTGELSGNCGTTITTMGDGEGDGNAILKFQVSIEGFNDAEGLHVHCIHDPIWPQPGDTVTITAVALGNNLNPREVDTVQIASTSSTPDVEPNNTHIATFTTPAQNGTEFTYICNALDDANGDGQTDNDHDGDGTVGPDEGDEVATTGFRTVAVGVPSGSAGVPVLMTGPEDASFDIVLIPDASYPGTGAMSADFLADARNVINLYYRSGVTFIDNQDLVNFWLARDRADAGAGSDGDECPRTEPGGWDMEYSFENAGLILHRKDIRDCSKSGLATSQTIRFDGNNPVPFEPIVGFTPFVHELGHALFSLADEYCNTRSGGNPNGSCDGGYFQISRFPNLFAGSSACTTDRTNDQNAPETAVCECFVSQDMDTMGQEFCTYDPASNDLMSDNKLPRYLDNRRINDVFARCAGC